MSTNSRLEYLGSRGGEAARSSMHLLAVGGRFIARLIATWSPRFLGFYQAEPTGWHTYRYIPSIGAKRLVAPWEYVAIFASLILSMLLLRSGKYGWLLISCICVLIILLAVAARRSQRICDWWVAFQEWVTQQIWLKSRSVRWKFRLAIALLRHQAPVAGRSAKTWTISFLRFMWISGWRFVGFRQNDNGGMYAYAERPDRIHPGEIRRSIIVPWEAAAIFVIAIWAASSVEISLTAWQDMLTPPWEAVWRSWFALPIVLLVARRQASQIKLNKEKRIKLRQEEVRRWRRSLQLP